MYTPPTLQEAIQYFSDIQTCHDYMVALRWPDGVTCPHCGAPEPYFVATRRIWRCREKACGKQFSIKVGTIMEDSPIGLDKWLTAMWMIGNCKNGVSSYEVHRAIGVTQKTAWFLLHRIRLAMHETPTGQLSGEVEADETLIGGSLRFMHPDKKAQAKGRSNDGKAIVMGVLERKGKVRSKVVPNVKGGTLRPEVRRNVTPGSTLFTDDLHSYRGLSREYVHEVINHAECYVKGRVHTNCIENYWSLLKRCLRGTYVSVEPWHLFRYLDEEDFRYNQREQNDAERFVDIVANVPGRRLTYKQLIGENL